MELHQSDIIILVSTFIIFMVIGLMVLIYVGFVRKKSELLIRQKVEQVHFEQELASSQIEIREQTLSYIGRELHDDLGQKLTVIRMMSNRLLSKVQESDKELVTEMNGLIGDSIQDIRNLSKTFITEQVQHFGLIESIEFELKRIKKLGIINAEFTANCEEVNINPQHSVILFRVVQECINNCLKHAKAQNLKIVLQDRPQNLNIEIKDDGIGFDNQKIFDGSGLKSLKKRIEIIGGMFKIDTLPDSHTHIELNYPKN